MQTTLEPPSTTTTPAPDTGIAQGAPSTGAAPSSFRPPNPAFEGVKTRLSQRLAKTAVTPTTPPPPTMLTPPKPAEKAEALAAPEAPTAPETETPAVETPTETTETGETPAAEATDKPDETTTPPESKKKVSPWRMVDEYKKTTAELRTKLETAEKELTTLKTAKPAEIPKEVQERLSKAEARLKEYEDEIRFTNYQKHPEFVEKYQKPYDAAWQRAIGELAEVTVTDPATNATRPAAAADMLALLNLPLGKAREYANQMFGEFADDAMAHRKEIKGLFDAQQSALKDARENGLAREKQMREQSEAQASEVAKHIKTTWETANRESLTDAKYGKFFTPVEGDQKGNSTLAKGFELVDKAFSLNPNEPGLTPEERADRVRRHVAMRNRAAAFGRMRQWIDERDARIAELEKRLDDYTSTEPGQGAPTPKSKPVESKPADPFARLRENLQKRAH